MNTEFELISIRRQIAKAFGEIDHGDTAMAVLSLCEGLKAMLQYLETQNAILDRMTRKLEHDYEGIEGLLHKLEKQMEPEPPMRPRILRK